MSNKKMQPDSEEVEVCKLVFEERPAHTRRPGMSEKNCL